MVYPSVLSCWICSLDRSAGLENPGVSFEASEVRNMRCTTLDTRKLVIPTQKRQRNMKLYMNVIA